MSSVQSFLTWLLTQMQVVVLTLKPSGHLGRMFPLAHIYGIDMKCFPAIYYKPDNVQLLWHTNILDQPSGHGALSPKSMDLVFSRNLYAYMEDWPGYFRNSFKVLKPGGYLEVHETDNDWHIGDETISTSWRWLKAMKTLEGYRHVDWDCARKVAGWMKTAGFQDVQVRRFRIPEGDWLSQEGRSETREYGVYTSAGSVRNERNILKECLDPSSLREVLSPHALVKASKEAATYLEEFDQTRKPMKGRYRLLYASFGRKPL